MQPRVGGSQGSQPSGPSGSGTEADLGGQSPLWLGDTAAHPRAWLRCHLAWEQLLGQPKAKSERAHIRKELPAQLTLVRTRPLIKANAKNAQCKHCQPTSVIVCPPAGPGAGWESEDGRRHRWDRVGPVVRPAVWSDSRECGPTSCAPQAGLPGQSTGRVEEGRVLRPGSHNPEIQHLSRITLI